MLVRDNQDVSLVDTVYLLSKSPVITIADIPHIIINKGDNSSQIIYHRDAQK